ncbi:hypothetical protein [Microbacterium sp. RURRCA19A]|uniref:hypothetical protein n=1 Tax=Microbacterium sp. RURRCA19A TaxID=1907391 RepID=UPI0009566670|nr:hypothetical protein [Microbacterium sp. RURRCA19A]SIS09860.1 hypothetical protein SAMN05880568_2731 [Microbacterium sp. RURRCA19A]
MKERVAALLDRVVVGYAPTARPFAVVRIVFAIKVMLFSGDLLWIGQVPAQFFVPPPGPFSLITEQPSVEALVALTVVRTVVAVWLLVGWKTLWASAATTLILLVAAGLSYSFGKVDHFILFDLAPLAFGLAGWGAAWSLDARRREHTTRGYPMFLFATVVGFAMLTAALPKIRAGWLDPSREATRYFVARDEVAGPLPGPWGEFALTIDVALFWKLLDWATIFAEGWLIFVILLPRVFRLGLALVVLFHIGVFVLMGIDFFDNLYAYAGFFCVPVARWFPDPRALIRRRRAAALPD